MTKKAKEHNQSIIQKEKVITKKVNIKNNHIKLKSFLLINLIIPILSSSYLIRFNFSNITLKIKGRGKKNLFTSFSEFEKELYPNMIYINDEIKNVKKSQYNLNKAENIIKLIWNNNLNNINYLFMDCYDIKEIDMSNFDFSRVTNMESLFSNCISLISIILSNINTSKVTTMEKMFYNCSSLLYIDLSYFDTSNVVNMNYMFYSCVALSSVDLSNFDTSKVITMTSMFEGCLHLEYINMQNFNEICLNYIDNIFKDVPKNIVYCVNTSNNIGNLTAKLVEKSCRSSSCNGNWKLAKKKIIDGGSSFSGCLNQDCYDFWDSLREYNGKCISLCPNGILPGNQGMCKCELEQCLECPPIALYKGLCSTCNNGYYQKENDHLNLGEFIGCYKDPNGYYFDTRDSLYKECYFTCASCNKKGDDNNHNCLECKEDYPIENNTAGYLNCYQNSSNLITTIIEELNDESSEIIITETEAKEKEIEYSDSKVDTNNLITTIIENVMEDVIVESSEVVIKKINETQKFVIKYDDIDEIKKIINETKIGGIMEEIEFYDSLLDNIENIFINNYNVTKLDKGEDEIIKTEKITITLTTTENQKDNIDSNVTIIDLGECENLLREHYNVFNKTLYIKKLDIIQEGMKIPKIEYVVYCNLNGTTLEKLNISICQKSMITLSIPIIIPQSENIDELNISSGYYNDICYVTNSESGTDIILKDRYNEFIQGNKTICQNNCIFSEYNYTTHKAKCSCQIEESSNSFNDMNINNKKFLENFIDIKNIVNVNILGCYKTLFCKTGLRKNIGSYILIFIILLHIINIILFFIREIKIIERNIEEISYSIINSNLIEKNSENYIL